MPADLEAVVGVARGHGSSGWLAVMYFPSQIRRAASLMMSCAACAL